MTRKQPRMAIAGPIAVGGAEITSRLVNRLLNDVGDEPDQLPILQHVLMRTWEKWLAESYPPHPNPLPPGERGSTQVVIPPGNGGIQDTRHVIDGPPWLPDSGTPCRNDGLHGSDMETSALGQSEQSRGPLDLPHYEAIGGMAEALSIHADEAYDELSERHRLVAEKLFRCLTEKGPDNREVRRPVTLEEIYAVAEATEAEVGTVIEVFRQPGRSFLMPPAGEELNAHRLIDVSHESLIRNWKKLREWAEQEAQAARLYKRLADAAVDYSKGESGLWRDPELQIALKWRGKLRPN
ncbi:MAG: hypothetical protein ACRD1T_13855, partial [Acidimicrobiia bacterium]